MGSGQLPLRCDRPTDLVLVSAAVLSADCSQSRKKAQSLGRKVGRDQEEGDEMKGLDEQDKE